VTPGSKSHGHWGSMSGWIGCAYRSDPAKVICLFARLEQPWWGEGEFVKAPVWNADEVPSVQNLLPL